MQRILNRFKSLSFKKKLVFSYLIIIIIPVAVLGIYAYRQASENLQQQARLDYNNIVNNSADDIEYRISRYNNIIETIAYNNKINQIYNTDYSNYFDLYLDYNNVVASLFGTIIDMNDDLKSVKIYTNNEALSNEASSILLTDNIRKQAWYSNALRDIKVKWYRTDSGLQGVARFANRTTLTTQKYDNIVVFEPRYDKMFTMFDSSEMANFGILLVDKSQNIIYSKKLPGSQAAPDASDIMRQNGGEVVIDGVKYLMFKKSVQAASWDLYYYIPVRSVAVNASSILGATLVVIGACLCILIFIVWVFSATIVKRIEKLNDSVKLVSNGNLNVKLKSSSRDEIGELTNNFSKMLENLNGMIEKVHNSEIQRKEAQLRVLQAQINPHFLYNSLSIVSWMAIMIRSTEISDLVATISKYYRTTLNKGKEIISIRDEVDNIRAYIDIQLVMHENSFDVAYEIDESVYQYFMINTILQPVVENAISHGIDGKEEGRGSLRIAGNYRDGGICFVIEDNGAGMSEEALSQIFTDQSSGYGIKNVEERIKLHFGDAYGLSISSGLGQGTSVCIFLPKFKGNNM